MSLPTNADPPLSVSPHSAAARIVVMLSGRGSNFRAIVECIAGKKLPAEISLVVSDRAEAAGLAFAAERGIPTAVVPRLPKLRDAAAFSEELLATVRAARPDLIVLAGFMRVLSTDFIAAFKGRIVNIHPSLLPAFRGLNAQAQALAAGVKFAGCTVHIVVPEVDGGPILAQAVVPVLPDDDLESLSARILSCEHRLYPAVVERLILKQIVVSADGTVSLAPDPVGTSAPNAVAPEASLLSLAT